LFALWLVLASVGLPAWAQYAGGSGTADDPYLIATAEQVNAIGLHPEHSDKHFRLTADIDMNDLGETPVNLIPTFEGVFDGNDHTIANLAYRVKDDDGPPEARSVDSIGLFRRITGFDALVKDLGLIDPNLRPEATCVRPVDSLGPLVGTLDQGWVRNCYVRGGHVLGHDAVGGLVGECRDNAAVSECWSTAEVSGYSSIGGLAGSAAWASIWWCHAQACASGPADVGGLIGYARQDCIIEDCFSTGTVTGSQAGGLVGCLDGSVSRCYSTASVSGGFSLGGLVGVHHGLIRTSWAGGDVDGTSQVGGLVGVAWLGGFLVLPYFDTEVADSYATGRVGGADTVGGLVGHNEGTLRRCYSTGAVTARKTKPFVGGLVAYDKSDSKWGIQDCFWDTTTSGVNVSAAGTGMTTDQMQDIGIYLTAGWDFAGETANGDDDLWTMSDDGPGYPKLAWEETPDPNATN
jgi:hypothetical protein